LAALEAEREALALRVHAAAADPQLRDVPDDVLASATTLLTRLRAELDAVGIAENALGDLPTVIVKLLAAGQPPAEAVPPMPTRRLSAVTG
jgi:hypothetical protein